MEKKIRMDRVEKRKLNSRPCSRCLRNRDASYYIRTKSVFSNNGYSLICKDCLAALGREHEFNWDFMDKYCQFMDIPFIPEKFEEIKDTNIEDDILPIYTELFLSQDYEGIEWKDYNEAYLELKQTDSISEVVPLVKDEERHKLQEKWGFNYDDEALHYLENLYDGLLMTQNISGALQGDQAIKICKISYELDCRIREGADFDKMLSSYDKLVKVAEFTPKNVKNASDFETISELVRWLEKRGFKNQYYDDVTRDVVDETIKNIQNWTQRLYINESNVGDEVTQRIQALENVAKLENYYDVGEKDVDFDQYENEGFDNLFKEEEFSPDLRFGEDEK